MPISIGSKDILKIHPVSYTNNYHDATDLVNHGMGENTKTCISWEPNLTLFLRNKKVPILCLRWHILRSYRFVMCTEANL